MSEQGIIELDVGLQAKSKSEIDDYLQKTVIIRENLEEIRTASGDEVTGDTVLPRATKGKKKQREDEDKTELTDMLESLNENEINKLRGFLKSPQNFLKMGLDKLLTSLGPNSAVILTLVAAITAMPILYIEIMKALSVKGGPFNRDWRRLIQHEIDVGLSRELVKRRELGLDQVIITQQRGFVPNNPEATYNSLFHINESRLARIGLDDRAAGVVVG